MVSSFLSSTTVTLMLISTIAFVIGITFGACSPPPGAITVGNGGKYSTLQAALADTSSQVYYVFSGTYNGQTVISRPNIKIYGQTSNPATFDGNSNRLLQFVIYATSDFDDYSGYLYQ